MEEQKKKETRGRKKLANGEKKVIRRIWVKEKHVPKVDAELAKIVNAYA